MSMYWPCEDVSASEELQYIMGIIKDVPRQPSG